MDLHTASECLGSIQLELQENAVRIRNMHSYAADRFRSIGTRLLQLAVEISLVSGREGRVFGWSMAEKGKADPILFHYKNHFRPGIYSFPEYGEKELQIIEHALEKGECLLGSDNVLFPDGVDVLLPPEGV